ncbi:MAG TPA: tetratricopeptide repeat protein, partial [Gammaproteobacteria bacterium]
MKYRSLALLFYSLWLWSAPAVTDEAQWDAHMDAAHAAYERGNYAEAKSRFEAALKEAEAFGDEDPRLALTLNNLAVLYRAQRHFAGAEPLYKRS